jgi:hypothetical protein
MADGLDSLELVGVRSWNPDKKGKDIGEVLGTRTLGVPISVDPEEIIALKPEVVLHAARDVGTADIDDEILMLLGAGINVITGASYRAFFTTTHLIEEPSWWPTEERIQRFRKAAYSGNSTFYVSGVNPDFMERLNLMLSGVCSEVDHIYQGEMWRLDNMGTEMFLALGMGMNEADAEATRLAQYIFSWYYEPSMRIVAERMGRPLERIEQVDSFTLADKPIDLELSSGPMRIEKGQVCRYSLKSVGYVGDRPFITHEGTYYVGADLRPAEGVSDDCYILKVEGRPSVSVTLALYASAEDQSQFREGDPTQPGYYATAGPIIQAIPFVVDSPAGLMDSMSQPVHFRAEMRDPRPWSPTAFTPR